MSESHHKLLMRTAWLTVWLLVPVALLNYLDRKMLNGLPADERLVSLGRSGPGVRSGFLETPRTRFIGVFLASAQTAFQSDVPGASTHRVRRRSEAGRRELPTPTTRSPPGPSK
ncbi:MAG: hypothetical protein ACKOWG_12000 [Planctomycetia bacterium]